MGLIIGFIFLLIGKISSNEILNADVCQFQWYKWWCRAWDRWWTSSLPCTLRTGTTSTQREDTTTTTTTTTSSRTRSSSEEWVTPSVRLVLRWIFSVRWAPPSGGPGWGTSPECEACSLVPPLSFLFKQFLLSRGNLARCRQKNYPSLVNWHISRYSV